MSHSNQRVLIAGCGYVGQALGLRLNALGHQVWGLRRDPRSLPAEIYPLAADLGEISSLRRLPTEIDYVVYATAADRSSEDAYRVAYVDGLANLMKALLNQGQMPKRIFFVSSTAVYGQTNGEWVDESSLTEPPRFNGKILLEAESSLSTGPWPATIVRLGGIYGPTRTRWIRMVLAGDVRLYDGPPQYSNRIHRDDCAGALSHLLHLDSKSESMCRDLYLGVDQDPAARNEVLRWLVERLELSSPPTARDSLAKSARRQRGGSKRCSSARLRASGYRFLYPTFREGYESLLPEVLGKG